MGRARVQKGLVKSDIDSRLDAWTTVGHKAPSSPYYASNATLKGQADDVGVKGQSLSDSQDKLTKLEADTKQAVADRDAARTRFDLAYNCYASTAEGVTSKEEELIALGLPVLESQSVALAPPTKVTCTSVTGTGVIDIVIDGKGRSYVVEVSPDPKTDASYKRADGTGNTRAVAGNATGLHWVRVAMQKARQQSAWSVEFPVMVR